MKVMFMMVHRYVGVFLQLAQSCTSLPTPRFKTTLDRTLTSADGNRVFLRLFGDESKNIIVSGKVQSCSY